MREKWDLKGEAAKRAKKMNSRTKFLKKR